MGSDKEVRRLTNGFENLIEQCSFSSVKGIAKIAWENSQHFRIDVTTGFPAKWCLRNERRNSRLMTYVTTQIWVVSGGSRGGARGARAPLAPLIFRPNWGLKKHFFVPPPLSQGLDPPLVVLLTGWSNFKKSEALPSHIISKEFLRMFLRHHFAGNCGCATNCWLFSSMKVKKSAVCTHEHIMQ